MPKEEIIEGLKYALAKGEPLPEAMMSFYNAGYSKEDIEEAARVLQAPQLPQTQPSQVQPSQLPPVPRTTQRVSLYEEKPKGMGKGLIMMLIFLLILLLGILVAVFLFREELSELLGKIL
jgi:hypothetical protein